MMLTELTIPCPENISCKYYIPHGIDTQRMDILIVSFFGNYPDGSMGNEHGAYIAHMTVHGLLAFAPDCIILDLRELEYRWGNTLLRVFQDISGFKDQDKEQDEPYFPVLVVTSQKSRGGFLSLVTPSGAKEPDWHFAKMDDAIKRGITLAQQWLNY